MKKASFFLLIGLMLLVPIAVCTAATGGATKDTITFAQGSDLTSLDPHIGKQLRAFAVTCNMFEQLLKFDKNMNLAPSLAESWTKISSTEIKFKLRKDVKWHNGDRFTAEDVKFSFERMQKTPIVANNISFLDSATVVDAYTVILKTKYPYAPVLAALTTPVCAIVPKKVVEADPSKFALNPIGTGPYKFVEWKPDNYCKLEAFSDYYGEKAKTKYLVMKVVPESTQRSIMLETGEIDVAYDISPNDVTRIEKGKSVALLKGESMKAISINLNTKSKGPTSNKLVRQAIAYAIDKEAIVAGVLNNLGQAGDLPVPPAAFGYNDKIHGPTYDVKKAKALLKEAGFEKGFDCSIWVEEDQTFIEICTVLQSQLLDIGINMKIEVMKQATMQSRIQGNQDFDMAISYYNNLVGDADYNLFSNFDPSSMSNYSRYNNPEVNELILKSREQMDDNARKAVLNKIYPILMADSPMITLYYETMRVGVSKKVEGLTLSNIGAHKYQNVVVYK